MVELWHNPSGEVQLSNVPNKTKTALGGSSGSSSSEDNAEIMELRNTIASLKAEIEMVRGCLLCWCMVL